MAVAMASSSSPSLSFLLPHSCEAHFCTISFSGEHKPTPGGLALMRPPKAEVRLHVQQKRFWCSRTQDGEDLTVDGFVDEANEERSFTLDLYSLLPPTVDHAVLEMLRPIRSAQAMQRLDRARLSSFVRAAAVEAAKKMGTDLLLVVRIGVDTALWYHEEEALEAAIRESSSPPSGDEAAAEDLRCMADSCTVCLESMSFSEGEEVFMLSCSHAFHRSCIMEWMNRTASCPLCRLSHMRLAADH